MIRFVYYFGGFIMINNQIFNVKMEFNNWIKEYIRIFLVSFLLVLVCNISVFLDTLSAADFNTFSEYYISNYWDLSNGRFFTKYVTLMRWGACVPIIIGIISAFYLSISVCILIDIFSIKQRLAKLLICFIIATSPSFFDIYTNYYCADAYIIAFLLAVLSIYFVYKINNFLVGITLGGICLACSLGIYQATIGVACGLILLIPIHRLLNTNEKIKNILMQLLISLIVIITGIIIYFIVLKIHLSFYDIQMSSYSGADKIGVKSLAKIPLLAPDAIKSFYRYFFSDIIINNTYYKRNWLNLLLFIFMIANFLCVFVYMGKKEIKRILFCIILSILIPFGLSCIELLVPERDINIIMAFPFVLLYIFIIGNSLCLEKTKILKFNNFISFILLCLICYSNFIMNNTSAYVIKMNVEQNKTKAINIINRIETTPGYSTDMKIVFVGSTFVNNYYKNSSALIPMVKGNTVSNDQIWGDAWLSNLNWKTFIRNQLGMDLNIDVIDYTGFLDLLETEEFKNMPIYPAVDSIKIINNVMVVKFYNF